MCWIWLMKGCFFDLFVICIFGGLLLFLSCFLFIWVVPCTFLVIVSWGFGMSGLFCIWQ